MCGVCGTNDSRHGESVLARAYYAPNWVAEHLGASSRRPRHPFPALMAGEPWPCTCVHGPKKIKPVDECQLRSLHSLLHCLDHHRHLSLRNDRQCATVSGIDVATVGSGPSSPRLHPRTRCNCGISTVASQTAPRSLPDLHNQHQPPCQCTATGELRGLLNSETMGTCLCAPTGMMTTLLMNCNSGFSTVFCTARRSGSGHLSCTQRARQPCPKAAPVEHHEEAAQFAPVWPNNGHINSLSRNCNRGISMVC